MGRIRMSETELTELAGKVRKQKQNIESVTSSGGRAVGQADPDWRSAAFDTFKERWQKDRGILEKLSAELHRMDSELGSHAQVAHAVNRPFR